MTARRLKKGWKRGFIKLGFSLYLIAGVFCLVGLRSSAISMEYDIGKLQKERESILRERKLLFAQKAGSFSMKSVEDAAISDLGMSLPEREKVIFVRRMRPAGPREASVKADAGSTPSWHSPLRAFKSMRRSDDP
ncbi:MAG: hypothetical protein HY806_09405 [Nitrospirae bacterium]|nr:hypothetical protein [Nitrospirota bacterium]MBI4839333.1 hypothetical protein [Nitrospirota bacterium]